MHVVASRIRRFSVINLTISQLLNAQAYIGYSVSH